eukprot:scaffold2657_cov155-Skeletonema_marinoi.AAC.7
MATEGSSKRRRVAVNVSSSGVKILYDLPIEPLVYVAKFLSMPSRAMFALALADDGSITESNSREIVGDECETLDFGDEKELAAKLSDGDIDAILRRVDAVNKLKILRLTNCINITGVGLESLRGSDTIEKIDLSLVGEHEDQSLLPEPPISCEHVLPILDTIINVEGGALKHLHFPRHWRLNESTGSDFHHFLDRFNQMLCVRGLNRCLKCNGERELTVELGFSLDDYGIQFSTCYACSKHYCEDCSVIHDDCNMNLCLKCGRLRMLVEVVPHLSALNALLQHSALDVKKSSVIPVDAIAKIARDLIVTIVMLKMNATFVEASVVANALPPIVNVKIATLVIVLIALKRQASIEYIHVKIVVDNNAFTAVCVGLTLLKAAALDASK